MLAAFAGQAGVVVRDLADGRTYAHDADRRFPTASVFKVPIMVELFRQVEAGLLRFDARHRVHRGLAAAARLTMTSPSARPGRCSTCASA